MDGTKITLKGDQTMAIIVNTNMPALNIQKTLANATDGMNKSMMRMATGSKINQAADDAAGMAVSTNMTTQIEGQKTAQTNAQLGSNLLSTTEGTLDVVQKNVSRIRDLVSQAANGTYDSKALKAIRVEIQSRSDEVSRLSDSTKFNGIRLFGDTTAVTGAATVGVNIQVGAGSVAADNVINLASTMFTDVAVSCLSGNMTTANFDALLGTTAGSAATTKDASMLLSACDLALDNIVGKKTNIGAYQNRLTSAVEGLATSNTNLKAARSTIQDADIAEESASYVQNQILQQASASLLASANQAPSIAINLV